MDIVTYYLVLITIRHVDKIGWRNAGLICLIAANLFLWEQVIGRDRDGLTATFLDIEKGSVACLEFEDGKKMLINTNAKEWDMENIVLPFLQGFGIKTIDVAIGDTGALDKKIKIGLKLGKDFPCGRIIGCGRENEATPLTIVTDSRGIRIDYGRVRFLFPISPLSKRVREFSGLVGSEGELHGCQIDPSGKRTILNVPTNRIAKELEHKVNAGIVVINQGCKWQGNKNPHIFRIKEKGAAIITTNGEEVRVRGH